MSRGEAPEPLSQWRATGFARDQARVWRRWRFTIAEAQAWRAAGAPDGLRAAQWRTAGVNPRTVGDWRAAGIDAAEAVGWHEFSVDLESARRYKRQGLTPVSAFEQGQPSQFQASARPAGTQAGRLRRWSQAGIPPQVLTSYATRQWLDEVALSWARQHIDASDAKLWHALGVRPAEAGRLTRQGHTAADVVRDWWRAGIPLDEVADWLGAGLTAQEAAAQRSKGITAERDASPAGAARRTGLAASASWAATASCRSISST